MSYQIEAGYRQGRPYLHLRDCGSGNLRLAWEYPAVVPVEDSELARTLAVDEAIQSLFKRLFLLTTEQYLRQPATPSGSEPST